MLALVDAQGEMPWQVKCVIGCSGYLRQNIQVSGPIGNGRLAANLCRK